MSNEQLLSECDTHTRIAAGVVDEIMEHAKRGGAISQVEARPRLESLRRNLQQALCSATELEQRANGVPAPKDGN